MFGFCQLYPSRARHERHTLCWGALSRACLGAAGGGGGHEAHRDGGALAPRQRDRSRRRRGTAAPEESGRRGKGWDEFPTETLGGAVEFRAEAANLEHFESSRFRWDVFNNPVSELSESFQFVEMFEIIGFPVQPDAVQQNIFLWHGVFLFDLLLHDIARQQAS